MLKRYGPACAFTGEIMPTLDGLRFRTEAGHLVPRRNNGPDWIYNLLPMTPNVNCYWDEGIIGLTNNGLILIASNAANEVRRTIKESSQVRFPADNAFRPNAEYIEWHREHIFGKGPSSKVF